MEQILIRFSQLVVEQRLIKECDLNPLFASDKNLIALDGRIVLYGEETEEAAILAPAIRPYPLEYCRSVELKDGSSIVIRPIKPEDEHALAAFHGLLSEQSVVQRYGTNLDLAQRTTHERLLRICFTDYDRTLVFVSEFNALETNKQTILSVARLSKIESSAALLTVVVADPYQKKGIGRAHLKHLLEVAKKENLTRIDSHVLKDHQAMISLLEEFGFQLSGEPEANVVRFSLNL